MTEIPLCLNRMGEEVLLALGSANADEERAHRRLADAMMIEILHDIEAAPERDHDWSLLGT